MKTQIKDYGKGSIFIEDMDGSVIAELPAYAIDREKNKSILGKAFKAQKALRLAQSALLKKDQLVLVGKKMASLKDIISEALAS